MNFSLNFQPPEKKFRGISVASCTAVHDSRLVYLACAAPFRERRVHPGTRSVYVRCTSSAAGSSLMFSRWGRGPFDLLENGRVRANKQRPPWREVKSVFEISEGFLAAVSFCLLASRRSRVCVLRIVLVNNDISFRVNKDARLVNTSNRYLINVRVIPISLSLRKSAVTRESSLWKNLICYFVFGQFFSRVHNIR